MDNDRQVGGCWCWYVRCVPGTCILCILIPHTIATTFFFTTHFLTHILSHTHTFSHTYFLTHILSHTHTFSHAHFLTHTFVLTGASAAQQNLGEMKPNLSHSPATQTELWSLQRTMWRPTATEIALQSPERQSASRQICTFQQMSSCYRPSTHRSKDQHRPTKGRRC